MVLILSVKHDHSTSSVMKWLNFMGEDVVRINSDDDIYKLSHIDQQGIYFTHTITTKVINVLEAKACWWRRSGFSSKSMNPDTQFNPDIVDDDIRSFVSPKTPIKERETNSLIEFIYYKLYSNCFIKLGNPRYNLNRLIVMDIAAKHGFAVPPYRVITNNYQLAECK